MYITAESIATISGFLTEKVAEAMEDSKYVCEESFVKKIYATEKWLEFAIDEDCEYSLELEEVVDKLEVYYYWFIKIKENNNIFTIAKC